MRLGKILTHYRSAHGMDQAELAAEIGIGVTVLSRIEQDQRGPSWETLFKILNWILTGK